MSTHPRRRLVIILGLASLACVVLVSFAHTGSDEKTESSPVLKRLTADSDVPGDANQPTSQFPQASRIGVVDNDLPNQVQLAAFGDDIVWPSVATESANQIDHVQPTVKTWESEIVLATPLEPTANLTDFNESKTSDQGNAATSLPRIRTNVTGAANDQVPESPTATRNSDQPVRVAKRITKLAPQSNVLPKADAFVSQGTRIINPFVESKSAAHGRSENDTKQANAKQHSDFVSNSNKDSNGFPVENFRLSESAQAEIQNSNQFPFPPATTKNSSPHDLPTAEPFSAVADLIQPNPSSPAATSRNDSARASSWEEPLEPVSNPPSLAPAAAAQQVPSSLLSANSFVLAEQPKKGAHWKNENPITDSNACVIDPIVSDFAPDPVCRDLPFDPHAAINIYEGKTLNATQRPIVELGRPWYQLGQLSPGFNWLGKHNNVTPQFLVYGDFRTAAASNTQLGENVSQIAYELNLDFDLKLTSTERFHMFMSPLDDGLNNTKWLVDDGEWVDQYDANIDFGYFEGDLGAIVGGLTNQTLPFDLPFTMGVIPMLIQNGVWMEDAFLGVAATIPARNSPRLNISNMDITFFAGFDKINSDAFVNNDSASKMYGFATFIDAWNGYLELDYAFLEDRTFDDRSYHNIGLAFTRRYGRLVSNSTRLIVNAGQSNDVVANSADGFLLLSENSLITGAPSTVVPYFNLFAGFDRPQSAARAVQAGGVLRNTGILFETDGMTLFPTLDATANDTYGGAFGINLLANDLTQQFIVEMAALGVMEESATRNIPGPQYGLGFRYQLPLTNALIFRADGMLGFLEDEQDVRGLRFELRKKW